MSDGEALRAALALAAACRRLHARGLLAGAEGNLSLRLSNGDLLVTPSGVDKSAVEGSQIIRLHADGALYHEATPTVRESDAIAGDTPSRPSSELGMHLACYAARPDVGAVVHAHPPTATGFATAGRTIPADVLPEVPVVVGGIALVPYGRPGTPALAQAMAPFLQAHEVFLLANHGVTAVGSTLIDALLRLESVEQAARILFVAHTVGGAMPLPPGEATALAALGPLARRSRSPNAARNAARVDGSNDRATTGHDATAITVDGARAETYFTGTTPEGLS